jgi:hypothetical protein
MGSLVAVMISSAYFNQCPHSFSFRQGKKKKMTLPKNVNINPRRRGK